MQSKINLLNLNQKALDEFFKKLGEKSYRTKQIMKWIYKDQVFDFDQMLNLSKKLREQLKEISCIEFPSVVSKSHALDGVIKWVVELGGENHVEMVYIPEKDRGTLCISSQVGCALACTFCSTGYQGFNRNLSTAEIIAQVLIANLHLNPAGKRISNVVFMGMGEPMLNEEAVYSACDLLMDDLSFGLSRRRVTISSSGVVPALERMSERVPVSLAISLHAPNNTLRDELVPINKKYPIEALMKALRCVSQCGYTRAAHFV